MKNECSIVRDILPLYAEKMVSKDTAYGTIFQMPLYELRRIL